MKNEKNKNVHPYLTKAADIVNGFLLFIAVLFAAFIIGVLCGFFDSGQCLFVRFIRLPFDAFDLFHALRF